MRRFLNIMCQRKFAELSSQITYKEKSNSYSAYSYSGIRSIERFPGFEILLLLMFNHNIKEKKNLDKVCAR